MPPAPARAAACTSAVGLGIPPPASVPSGLSGFHAAWYGQSGYSTLCPGGLSTATVAYYNSGTRGWTSGKIGEVAYLGTWEPDPGQDRASPLGGDGTQGSAALRATAPFGFRYQYLAGGVNTGAGWTTWAANAQFPTNYIRESANNRLTPVFSYYMLRPSTPGNAMSEADGDLANLGNASTM